MRPNALGAAQALAEAGLQALRERLGKGTAVGCLSGWRHASCLGGSKAGLSPPRGRLPPSWLPSAGRLLTEFPVSEKRSRNHLTGSQVGSIVRGFPDGGIPKRSTGSDCKSDGSAFEGSNPSPSTKFQSCCNLLRSA